jgi:NAD+ kinase
MKIAIYGRPFTSTFNETIYDLFGRLLKENIRISVYREFLEFLKDDLKFDPLVDKVFSCYDEIDSDTDLMLSIGGDGTFLGATTLVRDKGIPIAGLNTGRMGFLANISKDEIAESVKEIVEGRYITEQRSLVQVNTLCGLFGKSNFALNEMTIHKKDSSSMITIHASIDNVFFNTYWADGLIIATPTGSTAYSLSAGGPIILPDTRTLIISPIAPHNLTVRPIVVSDEKEISLRVEGRSNNFLVSLDHRSEIIDSSIELKIRKAPFFIRTVRFENQHFFSTLRTKLMWGIDKRN